MQLAINVQLSSKLSVVEVEALYVGKWASIGVVGALQPGRLK
jgi:hypothetical protein